MYFLPLVHSSDVIIVISDWRTELMGRALHMLKIQVCLLIK